MAVNDADITELVELDATKVSGVDGPANGTPFLLLKASADGDLSGDEADDMEDTLTKGESEDIEEMVTKFCGDAVCELCAPLIAKAKLKAKSRNALAASDFAAPKQRKLPMHDAAHVRNALARFDSTDLPAAEKPKAKARLMARAKSMGIETAKGLKPGKPAEDAADDVAGDVDDDRVGEPAAKMSPGVPAAALAEPKDNGREQSMAQSGKRVKSMASTLKPKHSDPAYAYGGESPYAIEGEDAVNTAPPVSPRKVMASEDDDNAVSKTVGFAVGSLVEAIDRIGKLRERAAKDGLPWLAQTNSAATTQPGSAPWESLDAATLTQVAQQLAESCKAIDAIAARENAEGMAGDTWDFADAADLNAAHDALDAALGIVARLSFSEGLGKSTRVAKIGRKLSRKTQDALQQARDHLDNVLGQLNEDPQASRGAGKAAKDDDPKEVIDMGSVTKEELADTVAAASVAAVKQQLKAARAAEKEAKKAKAEKKAAKAAKAQAKAAKKAAKKNAASGDGVGGNISEDKMRAGMRGTADANDVNAIPDGGNVGGQYVNDSDAPRGSVSKAAAEKMEKLEKELENTQRQLAKLAKSARRGGPVLDGQVRDLMVSEGRMGEAVAKSTGDAEIEKLEKSLEDAMSKNGPEAAQRASDISYQLTMARLRRQHENMYGTANPLAIGGRR